MAFLMFLFVAAFRLWSFQHLIIRAFRVASQTSLSHCKCSDVCSRLSIGIWLDAGVYGQHPMEIFIWQDLSMCFTYHITIHTKCTRSNILKRFTWFTNFLCLSVSCYSGSFESMLLEGFRSQRLLTYYEGYSFYFLLIYIRILHSFTALQMTSPCHAPYWLQQIHISFSPIIRFHRSHPHPYCTKASPSYFSLY